MSRTHRRSERVSRINPRVPQSSPSEFLNCRAFADFRALCGDPSDNVPGVRGIGVKTAAALLAGGLTLEDLPATGRLADGRRLAVAAMWEQVMTWRSMIRLRADLPLATAPCGEATGPMPGAGQVIARLGLWQRPLLADAASSLLALDCANRQGIITSRGRELPADATSAQRP